MSGNAGFPERRARKRRRAAAGLLLAVLLALPLPHAPARAADSAAARPIIAELFAAPEHFAGRDLTVYGLVIEASKDGRRFYLQDVSQMPLSVRRLDSGVTLAGDQIVVTGTLVVEQGVPRLEATKITFAKVVGGGGCC